MPNEQLQRDVRELQSQVFGDDEIQEPGLKRRYDSLRIEVMGDGKEFGIKNKVDIMWRVHVWLLCSFSAIIGGAITLIAQRLYKFI